MAEKKEKIEQTLRRVAVELSREKGFSNVTIKDICQAAGCSEGTFYYHFKSMQGLMDSLYHWQSTITTDVLIEVMALSSPWEKLWRIHSTFIEKTQTYGAELYWHTYLMGSAESRQAQAESLDGIDRLIVPIIREGQACGEILNATLAEQLATTVGITLYGILYYWYLHGEEIDLMSAAKRELGNLYCLREDLRA